MIGTISTALVLLTNVAAIATVTMVLGFHVVVIPILVTVPRARTTKTMINVMVSDNFGGIYGIF